MASDTTKTHPWHLVEPSPWPILAAVSAAVMAVGLIVFMHEDSPWLLILGLVLVMGVFTGWLRDVVAEAQGGIFHSELVQKGLRLGFVLFIVSEVMFFFAFFWAYFHSSLPILNNVAGTWPNGDLEAIGAGGIPMLNTLILLSSSVTVTIAHHAIIENDRPKAVRWTGITVLLGVIFLGFQITEYGHAYHDGLKLTSGIYGSTFYLLTGFHGFHVTVGVIMLTVILYRIQKGHFDSDNHFAFEGVAWYWHFVDVVWIFIFTVIYLVPNPTS